MSLKFTDSKGRISLGAKFANKMFLVNDDNPDQLVIVPALAIPQREAWLYNNAAAHSLVSRGLEDASEQKFASAPDTSADLAMFEDEGE